MPGGTLHRVADPTDAGALREAFIATYGTASEALESPELVAQYERVREYAADHPDKGSAAVATALELPRWRIRSWVDGDGRPDAVRGLERLQARGWINFDWDTPRCQALAALVAWVVAGGSIEQRSWAPAISVAPGTLGDLQRIGDILGIDWRDRGTGHVREATEWVPDADGSVLGRLLAVVGAPVGEAGGPALPT